MEFPLHEGDIRQEFPKIAEELTGDAFPCPEGYAKVKDMTPPTAPPGLKVEFAGVTFSNNQWVASWKMVPLTEEDEKIRVRMEDSEENRKIQREKQYAQEISQHLGPDVSSVHWKNYFDALEEYALSYPRSGIFPRRPMVDMNGNLLDINAGGSAPNVIG